MARFLILGAGMMGSALSVPIADRGHVVRLVGTPLDDALIAGLKADGVHPKLKVALRGPGDAGAIEPYASTELAEAAHDIDAIAFGVSSAGIDWACAAIARYASAGTPLFMITKGLRIAEGHVQTLPDIVAHELPGVHAAAIAGPCIAGELARRVPTCVCLAGRDRAALDWISGAIETPYYRVFPTTDVIGAEVSAALKNAYAMGIAFATGMHERSGGAAGSVAMHNLESAVMAQAVLEMQAIAIALGGRATTVSGLAGVGDLDVTTNGGRTGRFGKWLGLGLDRDAAIEKMEGATLECLEILAVVRAAFGSGAVGRPLQDFPLAAHMIEVALDGAPVDLPLARFFSRELAES